MEILKKLREEKGLSQEELAKKSGLSRVAISNIETGKTVEVKLSTLKNFSEIFDVPLTIFLS